MILSYIKSCRVDMSGVGAGLLVPLITMTFGILWFPLLTFLGFVRKVRTSNHDFAGVPFCVYTCMFLQMSDKSPQSLFQRSAARARARNNLFHPHRVTFQTAQRCVLRKTHGRTYDACGDNRPRALCDGRCGGS